MERFSDSVSVEITDGLATLRFARAHGNAINADLAEGLCRAVERLGGDRSVRGVLLAAGGRLFCPGLDLQELIDYDRAAMARFMRRFHEALFGLYGLPLPLLAAVSGHALAGGCLLALTADRRLLRSGARMGLNELRAGVPIPFGLVQIVREEVDRSHLEEIALLGKNYTEKSARAAGLAHEVHEPGGFERRCTNTLREMGDRDLESYAATKHYLRAATLERARAGEERHSAEFLDRWFSDESRRRMREILANLARSPQEPGESS